MIKIFVDSASSIKQDEKEQYGVEILPMQITLGDKHYTDGVDITIDMFYDALINDKIFPMTSMPSLGEAEEKVHHYTDNGDDVIIITLSSALSGAYHTLSMLFEDNEKVRVIDSKTAIGGIKILVKEASKYLDAPLDEAVEKIESLIPRIKIVAVPDTLEYLHKGGRLSKSSFAVGSVLKIKPIITVDKEGKAVVYGKALGHKKAVSAICDSLETLECDMNYPIVPTYTYNKSNLDELVSMTDEKYKESMIDYDNAACVIGCHWGPNAFGYAFVGKA